MTEKIRTTIYVNKKNWQELGKYIDCKKSEWIDKQIEKRINQNDDVAEIERQMKEIEIMQNNLKEEFNFLSDQKEQLLKQRELNDRNFELMGKAMHTIRVVADNQGFIEKTRVEFIANKFNLKVESLMEQIGKENIVVKDIKTDKQDNDYSAVGSKQRR